MAASTEPCAILRDAALRAAPQDEDECSPTSSTDESLAEFMQNVAVETLPATDWSAFSKYSAREMTRKLVAVFNRAADKRG